MQHLIETARGNHKLVEPRDVAKLALDTLTIKRARIALTAIVDGDVQALSEAHQILSDPDETKLVQELRAMSSEELAEFIRNSVDRAIKNSQGLK